MSNKSLAKMVMRNDPDAFRILYDDWAERIYAMAYDMLGDTDLAKSAAAECFFRAWKQTADLKDESRLDAWLLAIARQTCSDVAFSRRELSETDKEEVWKEAAARCRIETREWENTGRIAMAQEEEETGAADDDWKPLIFLPDEEEHATAAAETRKAPPEPVAEKTKSRRKRDRDEAKKSSGKAGMLLAGSLAVIAFVMLGSALVLALASAGVIRLPESLSGAVDAFRTLLSAFAG